MNESLQEPVDVLVAFRGQTPEPMMFKWGNRHYQIQKVTLMHAERQGREKVYYFSVSDGTNAYRLAFYTESLSWQMEQAEMLFGVA